MDTASRLDRVHDTDDDAVGEAPFKPGGDERRMHVRAYNHWVSLLKGRSCPPIDELDPASIADFGSHSVLLDFTTGLEDPRIAFLGRALRDECELPDDITHVGEVPPRSLLSRLTDHYLQIIANRAPIGFEAEFVGTRGRTTLYRGILMPFSSDGATIDYIYGVINWKELADAATQASLVAELADAVRETPPANDTPVWADGPHAGDEAPSLAAGDALFPADAGSGLLPADAGGALLSADAGGALLSGSLGDRLTLARESAAQVRATDARSRAALYRALSRAYDFALAAEVDDAGYHALLGEAGLTVQARAPMTPIAKLVFGADHDKTRLTEYAAVLSHARREAIAAGGLASLLDGVEGGIKAIVAAERAARRPEATPDRYDRARAELAERAALATVGLAAGDGEFVVLLARANDQGTLDIVARVDAPATVAAVIRRVA